MVPLRRHGGEAFPGVGRRVIHLVGLEVSSSSPSAYSVKPPADDADAQGPPGGGHRSPLCPPVRLGVVFVKGIHRAPKETSAESAHDVKAVSDNARPRMMERAGQGGPLSPRPGAGIVGLNEIRRPPAVEPADDINLILQRGDGDLRPLGGGRGFARPLALGRERRWNQDPRDQSSQRQPFFHRSLSPLMCLYILLDRGEDYRKGPGALVGFGAMRKAMGKDALPKDPSTDTG